MNRFAVHVMIILMTAFANGLSAYRFPVSANSAAPPKVALEASEAIAQPATPATPAVQLRAFVPGRARLDGQIVMRPPVFAERNNIRSRASKDVVGAMPKAPVAGSALETTQVTEGKAWRGSTAERDQRRAHPGSKVDWVEALLQR